MKEYKNSVEVYSDRTYTSIKVLENGELEIKHHWTKSLGDILELLKLLDQWIQDSTNVVLMAACYEQYHGSYNVIVDLVEQRERIINYADRHYKTFGQKYAVTV
jgi:hypothetical protein